jgi:hypothetical protein
MDGWRYGRHCELRWSDKFQGYKYSCKVGLTGCYYKKENGSQELREVMNDRTLGWLLLLYRKTIRQGLELRTAQGPMELRIWNNRLSGYHNNTVTMV